MTTFQTSSRISVGVAVDETGRGEGVVNSTVLSFHLLVPRYFACLHSIVPCLVKGIVVAI